MHSSAHTIPIAQTLPAYHASAETFVTTATYAGRPKALRGETDSMSRSAAAIVHAPSPPSTPYLPPSTQAEAAHVAQNTSRRTLSQRASECAHSQGLRIAAVV